MTGIRKARAVTDLDYDADPDDVLDHDGKPRPPTRERVYMGDVIGGRGVVRSPDDEAFLRDLYADSGEWS